MYAEKSLLLILTHLREPSTRFWEVYFVRENRILYWAFVGWYTISEVRKSILGYARTNLSKSDGEN